VDIVIDTDVLSRADRNDVIHDHYFNVVELLSTMDKLGHKLAVDNGHEILGQYHRNLTKTGMVMPFLSRFVKRGKILYLSGVLKNRLRNGLRGMSFDKDDEVFVAVCSRTGSRALVAEESDYSATVIGFLEVHDIHVMDCAAAKEEVNLAA